MVMKAYLANLPTAVWALAALPALVVTRCLLATVDHAPDLAVGHASVQRGGDNDVHVVHAVVPDVVRTVLRII